jgi:hypothetical protein
VSERERTRRRRVEPGEGADAPGHRRHAKDDDFNRRSREGEKAVRVGRGSLTGAGTSTPPGMPTTPRTPSPRHRPSSSWLRLHRRPDVSITAALFLFPPSLISSLFGPAALGCAVACPCLVAGLRAAVLPHRDCVELSGHPCPRARRRRARTICDRRPSSRARCAGDVVRRRFAT